jgi:hypothetical protein
MVSEQFDRCHGTLLQYVEFLCGAVTPPSAYAQLIPSLDDLVHLYHLDPEVCPPPSVCLCVLLELLNFLYFVDQFLLLCLLYHFYITLKELFAVHF